VEGCGREVVARSFCATHYKRIQRLPRWAKGGERVLTKVETAELAIKALERPVRVVDPDRGCSVKGCKHRHHANGLCDKHNKRRWRGERVRPVSP
jgi:hypothetical protein